MKYLKRHWPSRTFILLALGTLVSLAMWQLESTQWAAELNTVTEDGEETQRGEGPPMALRMILPFVKVMIFLIVPASLVIGVRALSGKLVKLFSS